MEPPHASCYQVRLTMLVRSPESGKCALRPRASALLLFVVLTTSAHAQSREAVSDGLQEVLVTAQSLSLETVSATRIPVSLRDVPQTIDTVLLQSLRDRAAFSLEDALTRLPSIQVGTGEGTRDQIVIRGNSALTDIYIDGMRDDGLYFRDPYNLERIEVVKGPAGVLYGRGSSGGIVNMVSKRPLAIEAREVSLIVDTYNKRRAELDVSHPFGDFGIRVNAVSEDSDSFRDYTFVKRKGIAPSFGWQITPAVKARLALNHAVDERVLNAGVPGINGGPAEVPVGTYYGSRNPGYADFGKSTVTSGTLNVTWQTSENSELRNSTRLYSLDLTRHQTTNTGLLLTGATPTLALRRNSTDREDRGWNNQTEWVLKSLKTAGIEHTLLFGQEFVKQDRNNLAKGDTLPAIYNLSVYNPMLVDLPYEPMGIGRYGDLVQKTSGTYFQDLVTFTEQWKALLGVRYDVFDQDYTNLAPPSANNKDLERRDTFLSPRAGLVYQPTSKQSYYISASRSSQPSGSTATLAADNDTFEPEISTNYEVGGKYELLGGEANMTVSVFQLIRENVPTRDPSQPDVTILAGEVETNGVEFAVVGDVADGWILEVGLALLDSKVTKSNNTVTPAVTPRPAPLPLQGRRIGGVAEIAGNIWTVKRFSERWRVGFGARYVGERYAATTNTIKLPAYTKLDAAVYFELGRVSAALNLSNLADEEYFSSSTNDLSIAPGSPIAATLTVRFKF